MNLGEKIAMYPTIHGPHCSGCGNPWYFDRGGLHECTTCGEQHAQPAPAAIPVDASTLVVNIPFDPGPSARTPYPWELNRPGDGEGAA